MCPFRHDLKRYVSLLKMLRSNNEALSDRVVRGRSNATATVPTAVTTSTVDAISTSGKLEG